MGARVAPFRVRGRLRWLFAESVVGGVRGEGRVRCPALSRSRLVFLRRAGRWQALRQHGGGGELLRGHLRLRRIGPQNGGADAGWFLRNRNCLLA